MNQTNTTLSLEAVRKIAPSVFTAKPAPRMSERYAFISTADLIAPLMPTYDITGASQRQTRTNGRDPAFTRHVLRLRPKKVKPFKGGVFPEVLITNSHDGQSRFSIFAGLFRLVCLNGLVVSHGPNAGGSFIHLGDRNRILSEAANALKLAMNVEGIVNEMMKRAVTKRQAAKFASDAAALVYGDDFSRFSPDLLLRARRPEDEAMTLWNVYNRVQENVVRGGVEFVSPGSGRTFATRGVTHIGRTLDFNAGLWTLAESFLPKKR